MPQAPDPARLRTTHSVEVGGALSAPGVGDAGGVRRGRVGEDVRPSGEAVRRPLHLHPVLADRGVPRLPGDRQGGRLRSVGQAGGRSGGLQEDVEGLDPQVTDARVDRCVLSDEDASGLGTIGGQDFEALGVRVPLQGVVDVGVVDVGVRLVGLGVSRVLRVRIRLLLVGKCRTLRLVGECLSRPDVTTVTVTFGQVLRVRVGLLLVEDDVVGDLSGVGVDELGVQRVGDDGLEVTGSRVRVKLVVGVLLDLRLDERLGGERDVLEDHLAQRPVGPLLVAW